MIDRYTRDEMKQYWTQDFKFQCMLEVEQSVAEVQAELNIIPKQAAIDIRKKSKFKIDEILEIEKTTRHDVIAFVTNVASYVGKNGRYVHYGLTSSDALDTALSLQIKQASLLILKDIKNLKASIKKQIRKHKTTLCTGRTHGMHAEPTSFGQKLAGHLAEISRCEERFIRAYQQILICKLSGAVGTYSSLSPKVESKVARKLKLKTENIATQVVPRDRHAELFTAMAFMGNALERLSVELRHLQRTEVYEVLEGFKKGQKGSSAMPHKKNPISAENLTGLSRLLRSYANAAMENVPLWHERDISHSSVERVIFPDAFIVLDYALNRMKDLIDGIVVDPKRMIENMNLSQGQLFSSHVLLALVEKGLSREEAYKKVQSLSHSLKPGEHLEDLCLKDHELSALLTKKEIKDIFSGVRHKKNITQNLDRFLKEN
ncbi:MAG: adenylosuccinate lyase [Bdellovibrionales bacterium]|nr:adenylosuccinate lyase [Bdellovibrionales bacterium]